MTLDEVEDQMPNGLHDAYLLDWHVDLVNRQLTLRVDADCRSPVYQLPNGEPSHRPARIVLKNLCYFSMEPPNLESNMKIDGDRSMIISGVFERGDADIPAEVWPKIPETAFVAWIYLDSWQSFMRFAASDAELVWLQGAPQPFETAN